VQDTDCPESQHCGGQNTCTAECGGGLECSGTQICGDRGRCVPAGECTKDDDCDSPPVGLSCDGDAASGFSASGTCRISATGSSCEYAATRTACDFGCANGRCLQDPCLGVTCNEIPAPRCEGGNTRVTYSGAGVCGGSGLCSFQETRDVCPAGCVNGACLSGFCETVVCDSPPASRCSENLAQRFATMGTCDDSTGSPVCTYALSFDDCDYIKGTCENAQCVNGITQSGEIVVVEYMANPAGGFHESHEWFEVINASGAEIDLNGWQIVSQGATNDEVHVITGAAPLAAGARMVFGRNAAGAGGAIDYLYGEDISMSNSSDWFGLQKPDGNGGFEWVDYVYYETGSVLDGRSRKFSPAVSPSATANDDFSNWCPSMADGFTTDPINYGTPGAENTPCVANPCVDYVCEKPNDFCADRTKAVQFAADSAMCEETRFNNPRCNFLPTEVICENAQICGSGLCRDIPSNLPDVGEVIFTEIMADPQSVPDADGEWFELYNTTDRELSLFSVIFRNQYTILDYDAVIQPNGYIVFVSNTDPAVNGGIENGFYFGGARLQNSVSASTAIPNLVRQDGVVIDVSFYGNATAGVARQLSLDKYNGTDNLIQGNWCTPPLDARYGPGGTGDRGTPGAPNRVCP